MISSPSHQAKKKKLVEIGQAFAAVSLKCKTPLGKHCAELMSEWFYQKAFP